MAGGVQFNYSTQIPNNINFTLAAPPVIQKPKPIQPEFLASGPNSTVPRHLPSNLYVKNKQLVQGNWKNAVLRFFVPYRASSQDKKVTEFFIQYFNGFFNQDPTACDKEKIKGVLTLAEQHIARGKGWFTSHQSKELSRLEHYTLVAREKLDFFDAGHTREALTQKCRTDNKKTLENWKKLGFAEDAFWGSPDLVDFVFQGHLHRYIAHPYFKHSIQMQYAALNRNGRVSFEREPHLLVDGRQTPWSEIRKKLQIDELERYYSMENGQKKYWMYLEKGFTQWDRNHYEVPYPLRKLDQVPARNKVEIVTTHAHKEDWYFFDRLLKGARHSYFRIIPGQGFAERHPETRLTNGSVYSVGWGLRWQDSSFLRPLATVPGAWCSPDPWEFFKTDLVATPIDVTDEQLIKLMDIVKKRGKEKLPFNIIVGNCCGSTVGVMKEACIVDLSAKDHFANMWYEFLLPESVRNPIDKGFAFIKRVTPSCITQGATSVGASLYSLIWAPIFSMLGAWRTNVSYDDESQKKDGELEEAQRSNQFKALFSNVFDLIDPSRMTFDMTKNLYKWQKQQASTYREIKK